MLFILIKHRNVISVIVVLCAFVWSHTPVTADNIDTTTTIVADTGVIKPSEIINFTIYVYADIEPVPIGVVEVTDINTSTMETTPLSNGVALLSWPVPVSFSSEGIYIFEAKLVAFTNYKSSRGNCSVHFDDFNPGSDHDTETTLTINTTTAARDGVVHFTAEVILYDPAFWYLQGGYVYIRSLNLTGVPVIYTYGPLPYNRPGSAPIVTTIEFDYRVPKFIPVSINYFQAEYTGSSESWTKPSISPLCPLTIIGQGFSIVQQLNKTLLHRVHDTVQINSSIVGDYPAGLNLRSYYTLQQTKYYFSNVTLAKRKSTCHFTPDVSIPVGFLPITTELVDLETNQQYVNISRNLTIVDQAFFLNINLNATQYRHNETIHFDLYVTEETILTNQIECDVELIDVTDGMVSLLNTSTDLNGRANFDYKIPSNASVGGHVFHLRTHNTSVYIMDALKDLTISIKGLTRIYITDYPSAGVDRKDIATIDVTALSGGNTITEGVVALEFALNDTEIMRVNCTPGVRFDYLIKSSHSLGLTTYQIHYFNSINYSEETTPFNLTVYSKPKFQDIVQNITGSVIQGQTVRISGQLVDEVGLPITYEEVLFTDTTLGTSLEVSTTDSEGNFYLDYHITNKSQLGIHIVQIQFDGDPSNFYKAAANVPTVFFTVRPPLTVIMDESVIADSWTVVQIVGGLNEQVLLAWQPEYETEWYDIGTVQLNSSGGGHYNWSTPTYKGIFTLRVKGSTTTKYDAATMYVIPRLTINGTRLHYVDQIYYFSVNASERYQLWIDSYLWASSGSSGVHHYDYTFTTRGRKEFLIVSEDTYVMMTEYLFEMTVFDPVEITIDVPSISELDVGVNIDGKIEGISSGLIEGMDASLEINGTVKQVDATGIGGYFHFIHEFDQAGYYYIRVFTLKDSTNYYNASTSPTKMLFVRPPLPTISSISPQNQTTYGSSVLINLSGLAATIHYYIAPLDSINTTWYSSHYRELEEGVYICHVYGTDQYNTTTHVTIVFEVDTTPPSLIIYSPTWTTYISGKLLLNFSTDADILEVYFDTQRLSGVYSGEYLYGISSGYHNLTIVGKDFIGNEVRKMVLFHVDTQTQNQNSSASSDSSSQDTGLVNSSVVENPISMGLVISVCGAIALALGYYQKIRGQT